MFNITILDDKGLSINVDVVRYFKKENTNYLMYTMNEVDESGYVKIFAAKMQDETTFVKVEDEAEWTTVKDLIKVIVREVKDGSLVSVEDLDVSTLANVKVLASRAFKLTVAVKNSLGENKKVFTKETPAYTPFYEEEEKEEVSPVVETPVEQPVSSWLDTPATPVYEEKPVTPVYAEESVYTLPKMEERPAYTPFYEEEEKEEVSPVVETPVTPEFDMFITKPEELKTEEPVTTLEEAELPSIKTLDELLGITTFEEELQPSVEVETKEEPVVEATPEVNSFDDVFATKVEEPIVVTPMVEETAVVTPEVSVSDLEKLVEELELKVKEYELRFEQIKDLLQ